MTNGRLRQPRRIVVGQFIRSLEFFDLFRAPSDVRHCEPAEGGRSNLLWSNFFGEIASLRSQ